MDARNVVLGERVGKQKKYLVTKNGFYRPTRFFEIRK